jgi:hypothetical protein
MGPFKELCMLVRKPSSWILLGLLTVGVCAAPAPAHDLPSWLPRYDLDIKIDVAEHQVQVNQRVVWTNRHKRPTSRLVFNVSSHYKIPDNKAGYLAKTVEILRLSPGEALDFSGPAGNVEAVGLVQVGNVVPAALKGPAADPHYLKDNPTSMEVPLPRPVGPGETVTLDLKFNVRLPQRQGRWGQWKGVTFLAQWLPVVAFYDEKGWQPVPFIPWHQPFFNEAAIYSARITLPADQKLGSTGAVMATKDLGNGWQQVDILPTPARDFALFCSADFQEYTGQAGAVKVRCLALPGHEFYGREMVRIATETIPIYSRWFGPFPYPEFTIVESYFGWNGNECGDLVMIDQRIFAMPHLARDFVDGLVSHEICHQWWYNAVGTNGYTETWMDEGLATYFSHRLMNQKYGKNNALLRYPKGLEWLPNIQREDYRHYGLYGTLARGEATSTVVGKMEDFGHLINLNSMAYDRGSRVVGMIEDRMGEAAFLDFMHRVYTRYHFCILRVDDFQRELEEYTGRSWAEFFANWVRGKGMCDWCVEHVRIDAADSQHPYGLGRRLLSYLPVSLVHLPQQACKVTVTLQQRGECNEPTWLGFCMDGGEGYQLRLPIIPDTPLTEYDYPPARIEALPDHRMRVEITLPCEPTQISVDPDQLLLDRDPSNNHWKSKIRWRLAPVYTQLEETDLTNAYDRWNVIFGPWFYGAAYNDPWYTRSAMVGLRAGVYRTQEFSGGAYLAYRTDDRDIVAGVDGIWDHWPWCNTQVGFNIERSLTTISRDGNQSSRGVVFGRYVFMYGDSLYLPPAKYVEVFASVQEHPLPDPAQPEPGAVRIDQETLAGIHYHQDYLVPYWDPQGGFKLDATYATGIPIFGEHESFNQVNAQVSTVKYTPDPFEVLSNHDYLRWLTETRWAFRLYGAVGLPNRGLYYTLGGGELFRGFDLSQRQGSAVWVASVEWRVPLMRGLDLDCCDHVAGLRNIYGALFYDVGDAYVNGHSVGDVAHAVGFGLRFDVAWFGLIERTLLRFDVAKTLNAATPWQFWFGVGVPF